MTINLTIFYWLYHFSHHSGGFDRIVIFFADTLTYPLFVLAALFFAMMFFTHEDWKNKRFVLWVQECFIIGTSVIGAWFVSFIIKTIAHMPRPFITHVDITPLFTVSEAYDSFPSGHATIFFALATAIFLYHRKAGYFFFLCAFLIAIGRVISGVHYPVDVVSGAIIGVCFAKIIHSMLTVLLKRYPIFSRINF